MVPLREELDDVPAHLGRAAAVTRRVLYVVHGMPPEENSGTTLVAEGYASTFVKKGWDVGVFYGAGPAEAWRKLLVRLSARDGRTGLEEIGSASDPAEGYLRFEVPRTPWVGAEWALQAAAAPSGPSTLHSLVFSLFLDRFEPDVVHVIDDVNLPLDLPDVAASKGIPVIRTVSCTEDLCVNIAPVSPVSGPKGYCLPPLLPERCAGCLRSDPSRLGHRLRKVVAGEVGAEENEAYEDADSRRSAYHAAEAEVARKTNAPHLTLSDLLRRKMARAADQFGRVFDRVIFSTGEFRDYFCESLPLDPRKVRVVAMGLDTSPWVSKAHRSTKEPGSPLVFAVAGVFDVAKGQQEIVEAFTSPALADRDDWRIRFFGGGDPHVVGPLLRASTAGGEPLVDLHGTYLPEELPLLFGSVDVGLSVSRFETFHRVTREYLLSGVPVITSRTFGAMDVIREDVNGLVLDSMDPVDLARNCVRLLDDPGLLGRLSEGAQATKVRSVEEEADELESLYEELLAERRSEKQ